MEMILNYFFLIPLTFKLDATVFNRVYVLYGQSISYPYDFIKIIIFHFKSYNLMNLLHLIQCNNKSFFIYSMIVFLYQVFIRVVKFL